MRNFLKLFFAEDNDARVLQAAGILRFVLVFLQGVILVKAGVDLELVGQIELIFFLINFLIFYLENGGRNAMISWVPTDPEGFNERLGAAFGAMHLLGLIAAALVIGFLSLPNAPGYTFLQGGSAPIFMAVIVLTSVPVSILSYNYQLTGRRQRILPWIGFSFLLQLCAVVIPVLQGKGIIDVLMWLSVVTSARWLFALLDGKWFTNGSSGLKGSLLFLGFALPLIFHALNSGLMDYIDGWIVSGYFGEDMFARYRYGARELPVNALLIGGLMSGLIPVFSKAGVVNAEKVKSETNRLIRTILPANCLLLLVSPLLYELVYSDEFIISARIFNVYALTLISRVIIGQVYLYVYRKTWVLALSTLGEILLNILLSLLFLNYFGLMGIPFATVVAFAVHKVFIILYVGKSINQPLKAYVPLKEYIIASIMLLVSFSLAEFIYF